MAGDYIFNYPIETPEAIAFWSSDHRCNIAKAFVAFSLDEDNYRELAKRHQYSREWRDRVWDAFGMYVNLPDMTTIPFTELETPYWECLPYGGAPIDMQPLVVGMTPPSGIVPEGSNLIMSVFVSGTPSFTYQWYKDDVLIPTATNLSYTVLSFAEADNGVYHVVITNPIGTTVSPKLTFEVLLDNPMITLNPDSLIITDAQTAAFSVNATGYDTVQWYRNAIALPGETALTLTFQGNVVDDNSSYSAEFINSSGASFTSQALLTVSMVVPTVTLHPQNVHSGVGDTDTLILTADAINYDTIKWFKKNRLTGHFIEAIGQTTTTYTEASSYTGFFDEYYAEFTNINTTIRTNHCSVYIAAISMVPLGAFGLAFGTGYD